MLGLTPSQRAFFDLIAGHVRATGRVPPLRALSREYYAGRGVSVGHTSRMIAALQSRGWITRSRGPLRTIRITPAAAHAAGLATCGDQVLVFHRPAYLFGVPA